MRQLLLTAFGAWGALLPNQPALAQLADETYTFSGEVASTCSINGLNSDYSLFLTQNDYLGISHQAFEVNTNSPVKLTARYEIVDEVSGYTPAHRKVHVRQIVGGEASNPVIASAPNTESAWLFLSDTPGTATVEIRMFVGPTPPPGNYSYRATITCWQL